MPCAAAIFFRGLLTKINITTKIAKTSANAPRIISFEMESPAGAAATDPAAVAAGASVISVGNNIINVLI